MRNSVSNIRACFQSVIKHMLNYRGFKYSKDHIKKLLDIIIKFNPGFPEAETLDTKIWKVAVNDVQNSQLYITVLDYAISMLVAGRTASLTISYSFPFRFSS